MNPRSDLDFSSPKVDLMVNLSEVAIELNKPQVGSVIVCAQYFNDVQHGNEGVRAMRLHCAESQYLLHFYPHLEET